MTFFKMTLSIMGLKETLSITMLCQYTECQYTECHYAAFIYCYPECLYDECRFAECRMQIAVAPLFQTLLQTKFGNVNIFWANVDAKARFNVLY